MKKKKTGIKKSKSKKLKDLKIRKLHNLIKIIERKKEFLFIIHKDDIAVDILDRDSEDCLDGGYFCSVREMYDYIKYYYA